MDLAFHCHHIYILETLPDESKTNKSEDKKSEDKNILEKDLTKEKRLKEEEAKQKIDKLKAFLREIAQVSKENKSCRSSEKCNLELERTNKYEYPDFVAFLQCGRSSEKSELVHNSSESGSDDK